MKENNIIKEFICVPFMCNYNTDNFKIYAVHIDEEKYPNLRKNKYYNYTILGNCHDLALNIPYKVKAEEQKSKNGFGYQYKIIHIKRERPTNETTTRMFLSEILTHDQVETIMNNYPNIVDKVINNEINDIDLNKLHNIGEYRFNVIKRKIEENFVFAELIEMFQGLIDMNTVKKLYDKYPSTLKVKQEIQNKPYHCLYSLSNVGFKTADNIILQLDKESKKMKEKGEKPNIYFDFNVKKSLERAIAAIEYLLNENENSGHTRIEIMELKDQFENLVPSCANNFTTAIKESDKFHIDKNSKTISILETYQTEKYVANRIKEGLKQENKWDNIVEIEQFRQLGEDELTDEQFNAVKMFYENNISILNGNAGTGKSFTTQAILNLVKQLNKSFHLLCPTGRASKILSGYTGEDAYTIHRGLGFNPRELIQWFYNEDNKLPFDVVIVDETSMMDIFLMEKLIAAIDFSRTKLLFIGDDFQIPSVGAGNVLYDLIHSKIIPTTSLTKVFRFGIGGISTISTKTRMGENWIENKNNYNVFGEDKSYVFMPMNQEKIVKVLKELYLKLIKKGEKPKDILVLSSYNVGDYGSIKINKIIQSIANKNSKNTYGFNVGDITFYLDDIVIQTKNNYKATIYNSDDFDPFDKEVMRTTFISNGDIGKVILVEKEYIVVQFDNEKIIYTKEDAFNLKLAYCISTFKSQGGQCKNIILITPRAHTFLLNANLIYVGQTRAKEKCYHLGEVKTISNSIKKRANLNRKTNLKELLKIN